MIGEIDQSSFTIGRTVFDQIVVVNVERVTIGPVLLSREHGAVQALDAGHVVVPAKLGLAGIAFDEHEPVAASSGVTPLLKYAIGNGRSALGAEGGVAGERGLFIGACVCLRIALFTTIDVDDALKLPAAGKAILIILNGLLNLIKYIT